MLKRDELITFVYKVVGNDLINKVHRDDDLANGVQFFGGENVKKVALGVSLNEEFLQEAVSWGSNFCIFHHGFDVRTWKSRYPTYSQKRLRLIFKNDLTIMGFHGVLDEHPEIGNNAQIVKKLGAKVVDTFYNEWGFVAKFEKPQDLHDLGHKCQEIFDHEIFVVAGGQKKVRTIGVCSGAAKPYEEQVAEMETKGVELFISGETSESAPHKMMEAGINYFVCGHYATEKFGIQALGDKIRTKYKEKLMVKFIDIQNPI